eukprot:TRINITY_DN21192_c0_g1_i2.p1 TRINITY_DN21192_c0_g1~~TRINITY_DN21192_c0_g1_i2.p1  ORF type:complete len:108 (+),score=15.85 TRINITY_DN21192_c0_g1_i2:140-463(+)
MIRRPPRSTHCISSAASDVYKRQLENSYCNWQNLYDCILFRSSIFQSFQNSFLCKGHYTFGSAISQFIRRFKLLIQFYAYQLFLACFAFSYFKILPHVLCVLSLIHI